MIENLKAYRLLKGYRGQEGVNTEIFSKFVSKVSQLVTIAPEISELDINPLIANNDKIVAVDARIKIDKSV